MIKSHSRKRKAGSRKMEESEHAMEYETLKLLEKEVPLALTVLYLVRKLAEGSDLANDCGFICREILSLSEENIGDKACKNG